jgi:hypothetical protein
MAQRPRAAHNSQEDMARSATAVRLVSMTLALGLASPARAQPADAGDDRNGGFRLETRPKVLEVFGDSARYRAHVDRFFTLADEMAATRARFTSDVQLVLAVLATSLTVGGKRTCPVDAVAPAVARAHVAGEAYQLQGRELETHAAEIARLASMGETAGLTPDYRWRVVRAAKIYPELLRDWREMRTAFTRELAAELAFTGCELSVLITRGHALAAGATPRPLPPPPAPPKPRVNPRDPPPPPASAPVVTFFVDNTRCGSSTRLVVDGEQLGEVSGGARVAFRAPMGRHGVCLLGHEGKCGEQGTRRTAYIHEGWSIALRCD